MKIAYCDVCGEGMESRRLRGCDGSSVVVDSSSGRIAVFVDVCGFCGEKGEELKECLRAAVESWRARREADAK